jgi:hypothetical protein
LCSAFFVSDLRFVKYINGNLSQEDQQEDPSPDGKTISGIT